MRRVFPHSLPVLVLGFLALAACKPSEPEPEPEPEVYLKAVVVSETSVILPERGSRTLSFSVVDPAFPFEYNLNSPRCQVELICTDGTVPAEFDLVKVERGSQEGTYQFTLQDNGTAKIYQQDVFLSIVDGDVRKNSLSIRVRSEAEDPNAGKIMTGLPVVYVNTQNRVAIRSKENFVAATVSIEGTETLEGLEEVSCSIRGRGNTTWSWPKKPYLLKLDEKAKIFGMHKHKRWVLLANFMDRTLMRNLVSMKVSSMTSLAWTPGCQPVELVLNGRHMGSYLLIEQVRVDNHRVAITEMTPEDNSGEALTGGYLLELDFHYDNEFQWIDSRGSCAQFKDGIPFSVKYPDPEDLTGAQKDYIQKYITEVAVAIYGPNFKDPEKGYAKYLDVDSFIDYWIVFEVMCNHELGNPGSVYMYKDRGGKLTAGPCWDFDWGILSFYTSGGNYGLVNGKAIWYARLFEDPDFKARVRARFEELLPQLETIPDYMEECRQLLTESAKLNFAMWNPAGDANMNGGKIINGDENLTFEQAVERLKANYRTHLEVIRKNL